VKKRYCAHCGTSRFGPIRHRWGFAQFCTRLCLERYREDLERKRRYLRWLYSEP